MAFLLSKSKVDRAPVLGELVTIIPEIGGQVFDFRSTHSVLSEFKERMDLVVTVNHVPGINCKGCPKYVPLIIWWAR